MVERRGSFELSLWGKTSRCCVSFNQVLNHSEPSFPLVTEAPVNESTHKYPPAIL